MLSDALRDGDLDRRRIEAMVLFDLGRTPRFEAVAIEVSARRVAFAAMDDKDDRIMMVF